MWSSQCGPCRADARLIETTWKRWGRRGVVFVGVSVDEPAQDGRARLRRPVRPQLSVRAPTERPGRDAYGVTALPETFFISAAGDIVGEVAGSPSVRQMELGAAAARTGRAVRQRAGRQPRATRLTHRRGLSI